jgi:hypothetical protein
MTENQAWTEDDVHRILSNPISVGIGPFPQIVDDATWIAAQVRRAQEHGVRPMLRSIRAALHNSLGYELPQLASRTWIDTSYQAIAKNGIEPFLQHFIAFLRMELGQADETIPTA